MKTALDQKTIKTIINHQKHKEQALYQCLFFVLSKKKKAIMHLT